MKDLLLLDMQEVGFAGISVLDSHLGAVVHFWHNQVFVHFSHSAHQCMNIGAGSTYHKLLGC